MTTPSTQESLRQMRPGDYAALQRRMGVTVLEVDGRHWRRVRPFFYRPLLPLEPVDPRQVRPPVGWPGAYQFSVTEPAAANSFMNFLVLERPREYSLESLTHKRRQLIKRAAREFKVRRLTDDRDLKEMGHRVYLSFFERTRYRYRRDRCQKPVFNAWVDALLSYPETILLGGYGANGLAAMSSSYWVGKTLVYSTLICDSASLRLNVGELIFHELQLLAARQPGIERILVRTYQGGNSLDQYYLHRGCSLCRMPAQLVIPRPIKLLVRYLAPRHYEMLSGDE